MSCVQRLSGCRVTPGAKWTTLGTPCGVELLFVFGWFPMLGGAVWDCGTVPVRLPTCGVAGCVFPKTGTFECLEPCGVELALPILVLPMGTVDGCT